jgi:hypothetical protein
MAFIDSRAHCLVSDLVAMLSFYWKSYVQIFTLVTPETMESSSSVLHFKIEDQSFIFDLRDVTLACQVLKIDVDVVSKDAPVRFVTPTAHDNGSALSERQHFIISYGMPIDFECGAESVLQMERGGVPYYPPRIELEILIQFKTLWFQRTLMHAGPFVATRVNDRYQWTQGASIRVQPLR